MQRLTTGKIVGAMYLPPGLIVETFSRETEKSKVLLNYLLKLPPVKYLQFSLEVGLGIVITVIPSQNNNCITPLPPVYTLSDKNIFILNLQDRHTKEVKTDNS